MFFLDVVRLESESPVAAVGRSISRQCRATPPAATKLAVFSLGMVSPNASNRYQTSSVADFPLEHSLQFHGTLSPEDRNGELRGRFITRYCAITPRPLTSEKR